MEHNEPAKKLRLPPAVNVEQCRLALNTDRRGTRVTIETEFAGTRAGLLLASQTATGVHLQPQDRPRWPGTLHVLGSVLSLLIIVSVVWAVRAVNARDMFALMPKSALFWVVFAVSYVTTPFADWMIFRRLWNVGPTALGALLRKVVYNEMLLGYLGDAYFYTWARRRAEMEAAPFGAVKDVAILSAIAGNSVTLVMLLVAWPLSSATELGLRTHSVVVSLTLVLATSIGIIFWRHQIFSRPRGDLRAIFIIHVGRVMIWTGLSILLWHLALPGVPLVAWLLLATIRLLVTRLPLVPNKDVVFAGLAVFVLGHEVDIAALMTLMAGLLLLTHGAVGLGFAVSDLATSERPR